jgi:hypothetical protein
LHRALPYLAAILEMEVSCRYAQNYENYFFHGFSFALSLDWAAMRQLGALGLSIFWLNLAERRKSGKTSAPGKFRDAASVADVQPSKAFPPSYGDFR